MLRLSYGSLVIAFEGPGPPLAWLREFLGAAFDDAARLPPRHTVRVSSTTLPAAAGASEEIELFSLDGDFVRLPAHAVPDGSLRLRDEAQGIGYELRGGDVTIFAAEDGPALRLALLRVARELATMHALEKGFVHLHAAALESNGSIVAFAGPRRSGKTTLLLHALLAGGARYVTNDRLLVDPAADPPRARGMPAIVTLRDETLARFPDFARRLAATAFARERTLAEANAATGSRPNLSPAQLRTLARAGEAAEGPLRAIVLPTVDPSVPRFAIRELAPDDAAPRVRGALFLSAVPERPPTAFAPGARPRDAVALDRLAEDLARRVPCVDVRLGPDAYAAPSVWDAIRGRIS